MFRFRSRFNRKNTSCFYRRNSPCVGLRDAVEANELIVHLGASPTHRMFMTACPTILWDGQKLHKNRIIRVHINVWRLRTVSSPVQKEYLKQYRLIYYSDHCSKSFLGYEKRESSSPVRTVGAPTPTTRLTFSSHLRARRVGEAELNNALYPNHVMKCIHTVHRHKRCYECCC